MILPIKMMHAAADFVSGAAELPAKIAESAVKAVAFNPVEWLTDMLLDGKQAALVWLSHASLYGLLGIAGMWLVRKVWNRQDATWLRWQVAGDAQSIANGLRAQGRHVRNEGQSVLLVNAWDSGNVARLLQAHGVRYEVVQ